MSEGCPFAEGLSAAGQLVWPPGTQTGRALWPGQREAEPGLQDITTFPRGSRGRCVHGWTGAHEDLGSVRKVTGLGEQGKRVQEEGRI